MKHTAEQERFKLVFVPHRITPGYVDGLDRNREYEFMRDEWDKPSVFRLADCSPYMNVWGLMYREIGPEAPPAHGGPPKGGRDHYAPGTPLYTGEKS